MRFEPAFLPKAEQSGANWWFIFRGDSILVRLTCDGASIPRQTDVAGLEQEFLEKHYLGTFDGNPCLAAEVGRHAAAPDGMSFQGLRQLLGLLDEELFSLAGRAFQVLHWEHTHRFCGRCGNKTEPRSEERARVCPQCGLFMYPEVSPAIIVAVTKGREILLAFARRFQAEFYSVLAGFVEPGETFEECVRREVKEEVGIDVGNIRYFGNQPWPFPHSLMVAFTADYAAGEITVDETEITDARWFAPENLPAIPRSGTIARQLIDWFIERTKLTEG